MNDRDQRRLETELRQLAPARPPAEFMIRLRAARPLPQVHPWRQRADARHWPTLLQFLRWLAPAAGVAALALLVWHRGDSPANPPRQSPASAAQPAFKAEHVRVDRELVGAFDAVARLPDGQAVRFRCQKWMDQVELRDPGRGLVIQQRSPRLEVVPVRFETY